MLLRIDELRKRYGRSPGFAVDGVSLSVEPGQLVGLLGPNGAGKSTLVKTTCGLVRPTSGTVTVDGHPAGSAGAQRAIGYLAELFRFPDWCTADELLGFHQKLVRSTGGAGERGALLEKVGLPGHQKTRVGAMSKGMQQRLGIAQAMVGSPRLLLLDEPTSALDPVGRRTVRELLEDLRGRGVSVLLNSHLLSEVELVCDHVVIIVAGRLVAGGAPSELAQPRGVEIETDRGVHTMPTATREDVPGLVASAVADGRRVYGVRMLTSTLEDAYLEAVGAEPGRAPS